MILPNKINLEITINVYWKFTLEILIEFYGTYILTIIIIKEHSHINIFYLKKVLKKRRNTILINCLN